MVCFFTSGSLQLQRWQGGLQLAYGLSPDQDAHMVLHSDGGPLPLRVARTDWIDAEHRATFNQFHYSVVWAIICNYTYERIEHN